MYDSKEIGKVSQNLSLRLSPERKCRPNPITTCPPKINCSTVKLCSKYFCCNCCRYHYNYCCVPCCCCHCCCLNFDYNKVDQPEKKNQEEKNENTNPEELMESTKIQTNQNPQVEKPKNYFTYEQNQFNDFLTKLMEVESQIEDAKINLACNPDFNCEDAFRLFESNDKGYLNENDIKCGLQLIGICPTNEEVRILMKRFDLQKNGFINYADFFDVVVPFEKNYRTRVENRLPNSCCPCRCPEVFCRQTVDQLRDLFNLIINYEVQINNMRKTFGTLRLNLRDIFGLLDKNNNGFFCNEDLMEYLGDNNILQNNRDSDLLFIRLDKNRNGKIDFIEIEDEIRTVY